LDIFDNFTNREFARFVSVVAVIGFVAGAAMALFLIAQEFITDIVWNQVPALFSLQGDQGGPWFILALTTTGGVLVGLCLHLFGDHVGLLQQTIAIFQKTGRFEPKHVPAALLSIFLSLVFGASLGPEVAAIDMGGGLGTWVAERVKGMKERVRDLSFAGASGSLGGFLSSPFIGAIFAVELPHVQGLAFYAVLIPSIVAATTGFAAFHWITGVDFGALFPVPPYHEFVLLDSFYAVILGLLGGVMGILFIYSYRGFHQLVNPLAKHPVLRGLIGGAGLGLAGMVAPLVLFSGQHQFQTILDQGALMGVTALLFIFAVKILASSWCMATIFKGGPIFPLIFAGGTLGVIISILFPFIPPAVAITAVMAGMIVCVLKIPLVVIALLILVFMQRDIVVIATIATLASFLATLPFSLVPRPAQDKKE
jgi:H+/Cl- antiporter ClcA